MPARKPAVAVVTDLSEISDQLLLQRIASMSAAVTQLKAEAVKRAKASPTGSIEGSGLWVGRRQTVYEPRASDKALLAAMDRLYQDDPEQLKVQLAYWLGKYPDSWKRGAIEKMPNADWLSPAAAVEGHEHHAYGKATYAVFNDLPLDGKHWVVKPGEEPQMSESYDADPEDEDEGGDVDSEWE